jgi:hypothetical protein
MINEFQNRYEGDPLDLSVMVLVAWLAHIGSNLEQSSRYTSHGLWVHRTVDAVLDHLADSGK